MRERAAVNIINTIGATKYCSLAYKSYIAIHQIQYHRYHTYTEMERGFSILNN